MEHKIIVTGIGPGSAEYIVPAAMDAIRSASVLVGGTRALAQFATESVQETFAIKSDITAVMDFVAKRLEQTDVVVMVSGDPGYYSLLDALLRVFPQKRIKVIPGLSSIQVAFAKLALPWHDADLISMHGREPDAKRLEYAPGRMLGFLTDAKNNSKSIPQRLLSIGWPADTMLGICSRISYEDEMIIRTILGEAEKQETVYPSCVLVVKA